MAMIRLACPGCGRSVLVDEHMENGVIHCGCQTNFIVKNGKSFVVE